MNPNMEIHNSWFNTLHERRKNALVVFKDPEYINVFNGVIDKYCDSAHFIYELLQNADDAKATEVEMVLTKDSFIFTHNGKVRFTVSDPAKAEEDRSSALESEIDRIIKDDEAVKEDDLLKGRHHNAHVDEDDE